MLTLPNRPIEERHPDRFLHSAQPQAYSGPEIGVVLTHFKRDTLLRQLDALRSQTVPYTELVIYSNAAENLPPLVGTQDNESVMGACGRNFGVWPRFSLAWHLQTAYVAVFDDDAIPGKKWLENCLAMLDRCGPCLVGSVGVVFPDRHREGRGYVGWKLPSDKIIRADLVGHSWFMPRDLLRDMMDAPLGLMHDTAGEDYWLSYSAQKRGMPVVCPPHPPDDKELWGASDDAMQLGSDDVALWTKPGEEEKKTSVHELLLGLGWQPQASSRTADGGIELKAVA